MPETSKTFTHACILTCVVDTTGPMGGDAGHGGRTTIKFVNEGGVSWEVEECDRGQSMKIGGLDQLTIELQGDSEGFVLIEALEWAAAELRRQWTAEAH